MTTANTSIAYIEEKENKLAFTYFSVIVLFHFACLLAFYTGFNWTAFAVAFFSYVLRAMGITMGFHRYFAHRSFKTNRFFQFLIGLIGSLACQGGVLWWSSHHRGHHKHSDQEEDLHSPVQHGFFHSHLGWMWHKSCFKPAKYKLNDFSKFPEIKFLNKYYGPLMIVHALGLYGLGELLLHFLPNLGTNGLQMMVWGFFISTVWLWHVTFSVNSVCHVWGNKRFKSNDESRNNWLIGLLAMGEGWHNNHHTYGWSARNGFKWYEYDVTYYTLKVLEFFGIVEGLKVPTKNQMTDPNILLAK